MIEAPEKLKTFEKVGPCLYRYTATGTYYALVKVKGRQVRRSLNTTDKPLAKRRLADLQGDLQRVDAAAGKPSFAELCDKHLATVADQSASTVEQRTAIVARIKTECPAARLPIVNVTKSSISTSLAACKFAPLNHNHHLLFIRAAFQMAVDDKILAHSPVADLK